MKKFKNNLLLVLAGFAALYVAYITGSGEILNYIDFADPLNEMAFFGISSTMGVGCIIAGFSKA